MQSATRDTLSPHHLLHHRHEVVIIGGGICGLATALAFHRKGIRTVVLEKADSLRSTGAAIAVLANGWRALDQLGIGSILRQTALPLLGIHDLWIDKCKQRKISFRSVEARCLKRSDLIERLASVLPEGTIHFGCQVESVTLDTRTKHPIIHLNNGNTISSKVLIGCDGVKSVVADFLKLKPTKAYNYCVVRGLTNYPKAHSFTHELVRVKKNDILVGRVPINAKLVHWFVALQPNQIDTKISQHPELIKQSTQQHINDLFPVETINMIERSDLDSLSLTHLRYREPWSLFLQRFRRGTVTVAGDAMHVMGPFLGQGGSAGLEDAVVLARNLSPGIVAAGTGEVDGEAETMEAALDRYVKERRMRVVALSIQTHIVGTLLLGNDSWLVKLIGILILVLFFRNPTYHTKYDCGQL